ncbi:hypothetical protein GWK08_04175 [Leptobacterium flavescens]|uniref:Uncharacterized protein n=1 Tax=Leptobacterium flavescens TaxID=472055 RepID=A0A6P0UH84_9FLAO|nr:hypothetical protein [Leptobacterium flavescens]NER12625.1 hypothetical protein [Leptobacterium flavescens]
MNRSDKEIKDFFAEMRKADEQLQIPGFEGTEGRKSRSLSRYIIPYGIAASFLILFSLYLNRGGQDDQEDSKIEIVLYMKEKGSTESLITEEVSLDSWESSSDALIDDLGEW